MPTARRAGDRGFSLIEVLVALIVLSVGLLGIAKMQALALASTSVAGMRSLAAVEADSIADAMHVNRGFWAASNASGLNVSIVGNTVTVTQAGPATPPVLPAVNCATNGPCNAPSVAGYDLQNWAAALNQLLPGDEATIACNASDPIDCLVTIQWSEQAVGMNTAQAQQVSTATTQNAGTTAAIQNPTYVLYVEP
ncbi:MAG TPA: type IV pilus modification protein PilV [Steroidobacteraceae bacterium]|nr:type IV pilus modification protein PilV [Steroidobacteraceae bacterium]